MLRSLKSEDRSQKKYEYLEPKLPDDKWRQISPGEMILLVAYQATNNRRAGHSL